MSRSARACSPVAVTSIPLRWDGSLPRHDSLFEPSGIAAQGLRRGFQQGSFRCERRRGMEQANLPAPALHRGEENRLRVDLRVNAGREG